MKFSQALALGASLRLARGGEQAVLQQAEQLGHIKQVAIVGAGAGGSSAAYHIAQYAREAKIPINITAFERNDYIGGRTTTVNAWDDPHHPVELGGSIFVEVNKILNDAVRDFNLSTQEFVPKVDIPGTALGVWNGRKFVFTQSGSNWWDLPRLFWRYGLVPVRTMRLMRTVVGKFLNMYEEPAFPFESITQVAQDLGLLAVTAATGEEYLVDNGISGPFIHEIVQASTRVNYASNLRFIHGLEAMVCMAAEDAKSVHGGNWQIFDNMLKAANATVHLETAVTTIKLDEGSEKVVLGSKALHDNIAADKDTFDEVILATPLQFSNISFMDFDPKVDEIPYVQLHTTLFTSPHLLSPEFFNLKDAPPKVILTTLPKEEEPHGGPEGVGSPGFFSISLLKPVMNPKTERQEYAYKIFSNEPPNMEFLSKLLGFKYQRSASRFNEETDADVVGNDITWIHRKLWNSYPYEYPRVTFERIQLSPGLWYTSGMDSFISTMETNALAGKNVARLIVDGWLQKSDVPELKEEFRESDRLYAAEEI